MSGYPQSCEEKGLPVYAVETDILKVSIACLSFWSYVNIQLVGCSSHSVLCSVTAGVLGICETGANIVIIVDI